MSSPQRNVLNMPGMGDALVTGQEGQVTYEANDSNTIPGSPGSGPFVNLLAPGQIPPRPVTTPAPVPQPSGLNLGFLSNPINLPIIGQQPLWLVLLVGAGVWFFVLPMLSEHKGRKR